MSNGIFSENRYSIQCFGASVHDPDIRRTKSREPNTVHREPRNSLSVIVHQGSTKNSIMGEDF